MGFRLGEVSMGLRMIAILLIVSATALAGKIPTTDAEGAQVGSSSENFGGVEELKERKRFGMGLSGGGLLSVLGIEADINLSGAMSFSIGIGTGLDYNTMMAKMRFFLPGQWVSPYLGFGVGRWWTDGTRETNIGPSILANQFLGGKTDHTQGFNVWVVSPSLGVQFMHPMGIGFFAELQQIFKVFSMANGTYGGMGIHWYF